MKNTLERHGRTDGQTDGQTTYFDITLALASRGKNGTANYIHYTPYLSIKF